LPSSGRAWSTATRRAPRVAAIAEALDRGTRVTRHEVSWHSSAQHTSVANHSRDDGSSRSGTSRGRIG
jgi:hypothetical protein